MVFSILYHFSVDYKQKSVSLWVAGNREMVGGDRNANEIEGGANPRRLDC